MLQILWPFMDFAIANAERLDTMNEGKPPASSAPGTKVHVLIKHLRPYLKIEKCAYYSFLKGKSRFWISQLFDYVVR